MRKAKITQGIIFTALIIIAFATISFASKRAKKPVSCKESMEECCQKDPGSSDMIWENLSRQFISSVNTAY